MSTENCASLRSSLILRDVELNLLHTLATRCFLTSPQLFTYMSEPSKEDEEMLRGKKLITYSNTLIVRFCLYGFLKNLKFFEPFLVTVLLRWGLSLTTVGLLISVEKITCYIMELPSGYLSDRCGARTTLCSCFTLYIISFVLYYFGQVHIAVLILASFFYGLAEAMRSGAHKSMVFLWLEKNNLLTLKSYLNGFTRSYSLLGSAVAAVTGIFMALFLNADKMLFLCSIPPYVLDFCIVASYPSYMNISSNSEKIVKEVKEEEKEEKEEKKEKKEKKDEKEKIKKEKIKKEKIKKKKMKMMKKKSKGSGGFCHDMAALATVMKTPEPRRVVMTTATNGVIHRVFKDYVQPLVLINGAAIMQTFSNQSAKEEKDAAAAAAAAYVELTNVSITVPSSSSSTSTLSTAAPMTTSQVIILGTAYFLFYIASSPASQHAYQLPKVWKLTEKRVMDILLDCYAIGLSIVAVSLYAGTPIIAPLIFVLLYVLYNLSKPLSASAISDVAGKRLRATVFSADAALQTLLTAGLAPLAGFMADHLSLEIMFVAFSMIFLVLNRVFFAEESFLEACRTVEEKSSVVGGKEKKREEEEQTRKSENDENDLTF